MLPHISRYATKAVGYLLRPFPQAKQQLWELKQLIDERWDRWRAVHQDWFRDPDCIWVRPDQIRGMIRNPHRINKRLDHARIQSGDWDLEPNPVEILDSYIALRKRMVDNVPWPETRFYQRILGEIQSGIPKWGCRSQADLDRRMERYEALYEEIRDQGYRSQAELAGRAGVRSLPWDEVSFCIGRHGDLLFSDGRHRFSIALLVQLDSIPAQVSLRHPDWQAFREEIALYALRHKGRVYSPLVHPDLASIPSYYGHERFELIRDSLPTASGRVLDIGAHWGYLCHRLEDLGFDCHAVELEPRNVEFMNRLKRASGRRFQVTCGSVFEALVRHDYDIVLALNIFHHFIKHQPTHDQLLELLRTLDMEAMYFGPHKPGEGQMQGAYRNYNPQDFVQLILDHSCLTQARRVGKSEDNRDLYLLTR